MLNILVGRMNRITQMELHNNRINKTTVQWLALVALALNRCRS